MARGAPYAALLQGQRKFAIPGGWLPVSREPAGGCVSDGSRHDDQEGGATVHWLLGLNLFSPLNFRRRSCGEEEQPRRVQACGRALSRGQGQGQGAYTAPPEAPSPAGFRTPLLVQAPSSHTPAIATAHRSQGGSRRDTGDEVRGDRKAKGPRSLEKSRRHVTENRQPLRPPRKPQPQLRSTDLGA